ncbi:MAG: hypothetical protein ABSB88_02185 [Bryobacteraceae bacterium]
MNRRDMGKVILGGLTAASYSRVMGANDRAGVALIGGGRRGREVMGAMISSGRAGLRGIRDVYDVQRQRAKAALVKSGVVEAGSPLEPLHTANFLDAVQKGAKPNAAVEAGIQACNPVPLARLAYWKQARVTWEELVG